jgi:hypothetical protein
VFGAGQYAPNSVEGRQLLAHELTHVIQQRNTSMASATSGSTLNSLSQRPAQEIQKITRPVLTYTPVEPLESSHIMGTARIIQRQVAGVFTEEQFQPVQEAFEANVKKTTRDSCIIIVNKGLRKLFIEQLKGQRIRGDWVRSMETAMDKLRALHLADKPTEIQFFDAKGRITRGTLPPDVLSESAEAKVLSMVGPEVGWYLFGLSIMDGYHSVLLAVDNRNPAAPKIYWMDQIYSGFDDITGKLDVRITELTKGW